jgi:hypothetical protein
MNVFGDVDHKSSNTKYALNLMLTGFARFVSWLPLPEAKRQSPYSVSAVLDDNDRPVPQFLGTVRYDTEQTRIPGQSASGAWPGLRARLQIVRQSFPEEDRGQLREGFRMEMCEFQEDAFSVFSRKRIEEALDHTAKPLVPPKGKD